MAHVVTESCICCKYMDCLRVCPVSCFREGVNFLVIDPGECIDCTLCVAECPAQAIYHQNDVPGNQKSFIPLNALLAKTLRVIKNKQNPLPAADEWIVVKDKLHLLIKDWPNDSPQSDPRT